jgi:hypothetical protein
LSNELKETTPASSVQIPTFGQETRAEDNGHKIIELKLTNPEHKNPVVPVYVPGDIDKVLDLMPGASKKRGRPRKIQPPEQGQENQSQAVTLAPDRGSVPDQASVNFLDPRSCLSDKDLGVWEEGKCPYQPSPP